MRPPTSHPSAREKHARSRRLRMVGALLAAGALSLAAACGGSALDPQRAREMNDAAAGRSSWSQASQDGSHPSAGGAEVVDPAATSTDTGGATTTDIGAGASSGAASGGATGASSGTGKAGSGKPAAGAGAPANAGNCAGFNNNQTGVTSTTITVGNSSDLSGPIPGLFTAAQQGAKAYVAYFNATFPNGICGHKLVMATDDSRTDAGADQQAYTKFCTKVFAGVGSMSAFDSGGAQTTENCGLPDVRATSTTAERNYCKTCFGAQATGAYEYSNAIPDFFIQTYKDASQKAAFVYLNAGASAENAKTQIAVETKRGMKFVYTSPIDVAEFSYASYVQQMKSKGAQYVQFIGGYQQAIRLAKAIESADYHPQVIHFDQTTDDTNYLKSGGTAIEGVITSLTYNPLFEPGTELNLYKKWLGQSSPGSAASGFGMYGWSAGKLFVEQALALGGKLTRPALIAKLQGVHAWTGGGMHGPMDVGGRHTANCVRFQQVKGGKFVPFGPPNFMCTGISSAK